jgi:hypothetical protein
MATPLLTAGISATGGGAAAGGLGALFSNPITAALAAAAMGTAYGVSPTVRNKVNNGAKNLWEGVTNPIQHGYDQGGIGGALDGGLSQLTRLGAGNMLQGGIGNAMGGNPEGQGQGPLMSIFGKMGGVLGQARDRARQDNDKQQEFQRQYDLASMSRPLPRPEPSPIAGLNSPIYRQMVQPVSRFR